MTKFILYILFFILIVIVVRLVRLITRFGSSHGSTFRNMNGQRKTSPPNFNDVEEAEFKEIPPDKKDGE